MEAERMGKIEVCYWLFQLESTIKLRNWDSQESGGDGNEWELNIETGEIRLVPCLHVEQQAARDKRQR